MSMQCYNRALAKCTRMDDYLKEATIFSFNLISVILCDHNFAAPLWAVPKIAIQGDGCKILIV